MTVSILPTIPERVADGGRFLDRVKPGWADLIDLDRLDLADAENCVLGQLEEGGDYCSACNRLWGYDLAPVTPREQSQAHGFSAATHFMDTATTEEEYGLLQEAWEAEIAERRGGAGAATA